MNSAIKIKKAANHDDRFKDLVITNSRKSMSTDTTPRRLQSSQTKSAMFEVGGGRRGSSSTTTTAAYLNQYKIFLGSNQKIKQVKVMTRCAKCASSALRPFLGCRCSQAVNEPKKRPRTVLTGRGMPLIGDSLYNEIKSIDRNHLVTTSEDWEQPGEASSSMTSHDLNRNILSVIVQNRLEKSMNLQQVDNLIASNKIVTENWSSPFDSSITNTNNSACASSRDFVVVDRGSDKNKSSGRRSRLVSSSMREYDFLEKRRLGAGSQQLVKNDSSALNKSTEYSFANLRDLEIKHYQKNERVSLSRNQVPETSNHYTSEQLYKFDVAPHYKSARLQLSAEIDSLVKSSMLIVERIQLERVKSSNPQNRFVSMRRTNNQKK